MKRQSTVELNLIMNSADDHVGGFVKNIIPKEKIDSTSEVNDLAFINNSSYRNQLVMIIVLMN